MGAFRDAIWGAKNGDSKAVELDTLADARAQRRRGCVLTCKAGLLPYYEKFGFQNRGVSPSALARQTWYDMAALFAPGR